MIDVMNEIRKSISSNLKSQDIEIKKYYGEMKEQGFETPCIMIAPMGDGSQRVNYELHSHQLRVYNYQVLYFPEEKTVYNNSSLNQRQMCERVADSLSGMRYIGKLSIMYNVKWSITDGTLIFTFSLRIRGIMEGDGPSMMFLEQNEGEIIGG